MVSVSQPPFAVSARPPHRLRYPQWQTVVATLRAVLERGQVAEAVLQDALRAQPAMGSRDRRVVGDLLYGVLRDLRVLRAIGGTTQDDAMRLCALQALRSGMAEVAALQGFGVGDAEDCAARVAGFDAARLTPAERGNVPDAIYDAWLEQYGAEETEVLATALLHAAPVDLRVNRLKADPEQARAALAAAGIESEPTSLSPDGLRLRARVALQSTAVWRDGWIEPQDEGSQLLARLMDAQPQQRIADYCAGAGGKTLALAAAMRDQGELWALDIDAARLARLTPRLARAGVNCVRTRALPGSEPWLAKQTGRFDAVLVDAPCSGTGTWRRQPDARLRLPSLSRLAQTQGQILDAAAALLRPGGRLVYATCSLMADENDAVVEAFLSRTPAFSEQDAGQVLAAQGISVPGRRLRLLPHRHGTDGFFAAILRREG
ncbi:MAG TPA: RsmB/NOP family class I SAM-dependent RNA methyltransferase [Solimonas sp.]